MQRTFTNLDAPFVHIFMHHQKWNFTYFYNLYGHDTSLTGSPLWRTLPAVVGCIMYKVIVIILWQWQGFKLRPKITKDLWLINVTMSKWTRSFTTPAMQWLALGLGWFGPWRFSLVDSAHADGWFGPLHCRYWIQRRSIRPTPVVETIVVSAHSLNR